MIYHKMTDGIIDETLEHYPPFLRLRSESGSENVHYSVLYEGLPEEFRLVAEKQLNETDEKRRKGLQKLKEIMKSGNMHSLRDIYLLAVLRCCKYNLKKSEVKLKKFDATYRLILSMAAKLDLPTAENILDDMGFGIIPYRDKHGRAIVYTRPYGLHQENYSIEEVGSVFMVSILFLLTYPITTVSGLVYFADCRSPNLGVFYPVCKHMQGQIGPLLSTPIRFKRVEVLDSFTFIRWIYTILSAFMTEKLKKRVVFHTSNFDNFHKDYDRNMLPDVYGGNLGTLSSKCYKQKLLDFLRHLKTECQEIGL